MIRSVLVETALFGRPPNHRGKVRDTYDLGDGRLLIVATDRISALDVVLPTGVPDKGRVLTQLSAWWFGQMGGWGIPHHFIAVIDPSNELDLLGQTLPSEFHGRSMVVLRAKPLKCEAIVRGFITGSGWKDYRNTGKVCGIDLPQGIVESQELVPPLFTPSTKAESGHDENIDFSKLIGIIGFDEAERVRDMSLDVYSRARDVARSRGIIIADTKFEFGVSNGGIILIDEVLTPDSSRFWPFDGYEAGHGQPSFDKQPVRDWLGDAKKSGLWDGTQANVPALPSSLVEATTDRYRQIFQFLTGKELVA